MRGYDSVQIIVIQTHQEFSIRPSWLCRIASFVTPRSTQFTTVSILTRPVTSTKDTKTEPRCGASGQCGDVQTTGCMRAGEWAVKDLDMAATFPLKSERPW